MNDSEAFWPGRFKGQVGVVSGGAIARATARQLLLEGARVVYFDLNRAQAESDVASLQQEGLLDITAAHADVTEESQVAKVFDDALEISGQIHFALNAAGIVDTRDMLAPIWELDMQQFARRQHVNLIGSAIFLKHATRTMIPNRYGRVVMITSIAGKEGNAQMCAYSASKGGVIALIKAAGQELYKHGVLVNGFAPGVIRTPLVEAMSPEAIEHMESKILMQRCGTLEEAAYKLCHLLSRRNSFQTRFIEDMSGGRADY